MFDTHMTVYFGDLPYRHVNEMFFFISKLESFGTHSFEENVCLIDHFSNCFYQYLHWYKYMYMYCIIHEQITDTS